MSPNVHRFHILANIVHHVSYGQPDTILEIKLCTSPIFKHVSHDQLGFTPPFSWFVSQTSVQSDMVLVLYIHHGDGQESCKTHTTNWTSCTGHTQSTLWPTPTTLAPWTYNGERGSLVISRIWFIISAALIIVHLLTLCNIVYTNICTMYTVLNDKIHLNLPCVMQGDTPSILNAKIHLNRPM